MWLRSPPVRASMHWHWFHSKWYIYCCYRIRWVHRQNVVLLPTRSTVNFASGLNVNVTCSGPKPANGLRIPLMRTNGLRMIAHFSTHR